PRPVAAAPRPAPPPPAPPRPAPPPPPPPEPVAFEPEPEPVEEPASDILDLTEQMAAPGAGFRTIDGESDIVFEESEPEPPPPPPRRKPSAEINEGALVSAATTAAVDSAFNTLAQTVLVQNGRTLEDLVKEMLRPLLKTWLDDNLPGMVER